MDRMVCNRRGILTAEGNMAYKQNIFARPFVATLRKNGTEIEAIFWAADENDLRERLKIELSEQIELVRIRERSA